MNSAFRCLSVAIGLLIVGMATAETIRCDGHIIERGMSREEVLEHCGPPDAENLVDENSWTYQRGTTGMTEVVYFLANGDVEKVESLRE